MDCHLLALKCIAEQNGGGTPELFKHITWSLCNQFVLSTSQVRLIQYLSWFNVFAAYHKGTAA